MSKSVRDATAVYQLATPVKHRQARLRYDRGTLLLEGLAELPAALMHWFRFDPRVDAWRAPAHHYSDLIPSLRGSLAGNSAPRYRRRALELRLDLTPYPHQQQALEHWWEARGRGLVVLPTGAGKTLVGLLAMVQAGRDTLILAPTIDLMQQWYGLLREAFPDQTIGLLGGGYREIEPLTVSTYDSAARLAEQIGNRCGLLIADEAHDLPAEFYRCIAEFSLAPFRLGLTATPERADGRDAELDRLIGSVVYRCRPEELAGDVLAEFEIRTVLVELSAAERAAYRAALDLRNTFLQQQRIGLGSLDGWNRFVMLSSRSAEGRRAMQAHREARRIAHANPAKLRALDDILADHPGRKTVIFTEDNATAYEIARRLLIPCITHQTRVKERQLVLERFRAGDYTALVTSKVLNEGVDVPDAAIGVLLSGSASNREFIQRLGRILRRSGDKRAILYEIVAHETAEERVAERRRETPRRPPRNWLPLFDD